MTTPGEQEEKKTRTSKMAAGMAVGIAIGVALGAGIGAGFDAAGKKKNEKE